MNNNNQNKEDGIEQIFRPYDNPKRNAQTERIMEDRPKGMGREEDIEEYLEEEKDINYPEDWLKCPKCKRAWRPINLDESWLQFKELAGGETYKERICPDDLGENIDEVVNLIKTKGVLIKNQGGE